MQLFTYRKGTAMTYGVASHPTEEILAAAGLLDRLTIPADEDRVVEVDILFEGALDESFQVQEIHAEDVAEVLFEDFSQTYPLAEFEVSVYDRTNPDDCTEVRTFAHEGGGED